MVPGAQAIIHAMADFVYASTDADTCVAELQEANASLRPVFGPVLGRHLQRQRLLPDPAPASLARLTQLQQKRLALRARRVAGVSMLYCRLSLVADAAEVSLSAS